MIDYATLLFGLYDVIQKWGEQILETVVWVKSATYSCILDYSTLTVYL